jgi:hypothetical protein
MSSNRVLGLCLLIIAGSAHAQSEISFRLIKGGPVSKATSPSQTVIRTSDAFDAYWSKNFGVSAKPKGIDWSNSELVAIHLGHRGSRSFSVRVTTVEKVGGETVVNWSERIPGAKALQRSQQASPYVIVSIPTSSDPVAFRGHIEEIGKPFSDGNAFPIKKLVSGGYCVVRNESFRVIDDAQSLNETWSAAFGSRSRPPSPDFNKVRLVAIFLGQCPTPGYDIVVRRIARIGPKEIAVMYTETKPPKDAIEPQHVTNPYVFLELPKTDDVITASRD